MNKQKRDQKQNKTRQNLNFTPITNYCKSIIADENSRCLETHWLSNRSSVQNCCYAHVLSQGGASKNSSFTQVSNAENMTFIAQYEVKNTVIFI